MYFIVRNQKYSVNPARTPTRTILGWFFPPLRSVYSFRLCTSLVESGARRGRSESTGKVGPRARRRRSFLCSFFALRQGCKAEARRALFAFRSRPAFPALRGRPGTPTPTEAANSVDRRAWRLKYHEHRKIIVGFPIENHSSCLYDFGSCLVFYSKHALDLSLGRQAFGTDLYILLHNRLCQHRKQKELFLANLRSEFNHGRL